MTNSNKQFLILMYWHIGSWKTTLAQKIENKFNINRINNDSIRIWMKNNISCYKEIDISHRTEITTHMNQSVRDIRDSIIKDLISFWQSIILDSGNIRKITRTRILDLKKYATKQIETIIIKCNIKEYILLNRLEERDIETDNTTKRKEFYLTKKKFEMENLKENEADHILEFTQNNTQEILSKLESILQ